VRNEATHLIFYERVCVRAAVGEEEIARLFVAFRVADEDRHDVRRTGHHLQSGGGKHRLGPRVFSRVRGQVRLQSGYLQKVQVIAAGRSAALRAVMSISRVTDGLGSGSKASAEAIPALRERVLFGTCS
jgi:hypothetical protein